MTRVTHLLLIGSVPMGDQQMAYAKVTQQQADSRGLPELYDRLRAEFDAACYDAEPADDELATLEQVVVLTARPVGVWSPFGEPLVRSDLMPTIRLWI
jgi:hypothetical protein